MIENVLILVKDTVVVFDHVKYILLVCVRQREIDYSLNILEDLCVRLNNNAKNVKYACLLRNWLYKIWSFR